jgi:hypothetical protein
MSVLGYSADREGKAEGEDEEEEDEADDADDDEDDVSWAFSSFESVAADAAAGLGDGLGVRFFSAEAVEAADAALPASDMTKTKTRT